MKTGHATARGLPARESGGFTLIELLAAIAIVALLAGLLVASVANLRAASNRAACLSNQRQIGTAMQLYAADHDGIFPPTTHTTGRRHIEESWVYELEPYLGEIDAIRICPAENAKRQKQILQANATSYLVNDLVFDDERFGRQANIPHPASTYLLFPLSDDRRPSGTQDHIHGAEWTAWRSALNDIEPDRHRVGGRSADRMEGSANYLFADFHAENIPARDFKALFDRGINPAEVPEEPRSGGG